MGVEASGGSGGGGWHTDTGPRAEVKDALCLALVDRGSVQAAQNTGYYIMDE